MKKLKITEPELDSLGYQVDPLDENKAIPKPKDCDTPSSHWDLEKLAKYARGAIDESVSLARKSSVQRFRAGHALSIARTKLKIKGEWGKWLKDHDIARTLAWEAITLFERAGSEEAVAGLQITEAYREYGVASLPEPETDTKAQAGVAHTTPEVPTSDPDNENGDLDDEGGDEPARAALKLHDVPEDETPPPKEDPASIAKILSGIAFRLEDIVDGFTDAELDPEERETICGLAEEGVRLLSIIIEKVQA